MRWGTPGRKNLQLVPFGKSVEPPTTPPALWYLGYRIGQNDRPHLGKISALAEDRQRDMH